jgi:hypothetical protein
MRPFSGEGVTPLVRRTVVLLAIALLAAVVGCSDDEGEPGASAGANPESSCKDMCTSTGFSSSRVDVQPNETNCFCAGPGTVTTEACTQMCSALGKGKPAQFRSGGASKPDSCQCQ